MAQSLLNGVIGVPSSTSLGGGVIGVWRVAFRMRFLIAISDFEAKKLNIPSLEIGNLLEKVGKLFAANWNVSSVNSGAELGGSIKKRGNKNKIDKGPPWSKIYILLSKIPLLFNTNIWILKFFSDLLYLIHKLRF